MSENVLGHYALKGLRSTLEPLGEGNQRHIQNLQKQPSIGVLKICSKFTEDTHTKL